MVQEEILVKSTLDGTIQPSLLYKSSSKTDHYLLGFIPGVLIDLIKLVICCH